MMYSKCNWLFPRIEMETTLHFWLRTYWVWFNGCKVLRGHALIDASMQTLQVVQLWLGMKAVTKCQKQSLIDTHLWERWCARRDWSKATEAIMLKPLKSAPKSLQRMIFKLQKYNLQMKYNKGRRYSWQTHSTMQKSTPVNLHKTWRMWITQVLCTQWRSIACSNSNMPQHFYKCYRKFFGVDGQRVSQMFQRVYNPTMARMNWHRKTSLCSSLVIPSLMMMAVARARHIGTEGSALGEPGTPSPCKYVHCAERIDLQQQHLFSPLGQPWKRATFTTWGGGAPMG